MLWRPAVRQSRQSPRPPTLLIIAIIDVSLLCYPFLSRVKHWLRLSEPSTCTALLLLPPGRPHGMRTEKQTRGRRGNDGPHSSLSLFSSPVGDRRRHPPKSQAGEHVRFRSWSPGTVRQAGPESCTNAWHGVSAQGLTQDRIGRYDYPTGVSVGLELRRTACVSVGWRGVGVRGGIGGGWQP